MRNMIIPGMAASVWLAMSASAQLARADELQVEKLRRMPEIRAAVTACMTDQSRLCPDVAPGQGRILRCLAAQSDKLSVACAQAMQRASDALTTAGTALRPGVASQ
jgi:hypothetical protein